MSERAALARSRRHAWASPGSGHDRVVRGARVALPLLIGVLAAFLVFMPLRGGGDVSFLLDKKQVEVAHERLRLQTAVYRGADARGRPFTLAARSAVQRSSARPVVELDTIHGEIALQDGPATLAAQGGQYDLTRDRVSVAGDVRVDTEAGYSLRTEGATIELKREQLRSTAPVTGTLPHGGRFSAARMDADLGGDRVRLEGNARLRIVPGKTK